MPIYLSVAPKPGPKPWGLSRASQQGLQPCRGPEPVSETQPTFSHLMIETPQDTEKADINTFQAHTLCRCDHKNSFPQTRRS